MGAAASGGSNSCAQMGSANETANAIRMIRVSEPMPARALASSVANASVIKYRCHVNQRIG